MTSDPADEPLLRLTDTDTDPELRAGLLALREDTPSDHSRRAVLQRLGLEVHPETGSRRPHREWVRVAARGALLGAVLGLVLASLRYWLG